MSIVLFLTGTTRGNALESVTRSLIQTFKEQGIEAREMNFARPDIMTALQETLQQNDILFAFSFAGIGRDIEVNDDKGNTFNLWQRLGIPFIAVHGDTPAYFFDRHINPNACFATIYAYREHYLFRKQLPHLTGLFGVASPMMVGVVPEAEIDFAAKEKGKMIFLKNGNDPEKLRKFWRENCPPTIARMLLEIGDGLEANMHTDLGGQIDEVVKAVFLEKGMDVEALVNLRLFFVAQLDDYLRRLKCDFVVGILKQFPVEIHGENWDHIDFMNAKCTFVKGADYQKSTGLMQRSLGTMDLSPNVGGGFHDRLLRAYGMHTLCITNEQDAVIQTFGENSGLTYKIERESLENKLNDVLKYPKEYVELGRETARIFAEKHPVSAAVRSFVEIADALRLNAAKHPLPGWQQDFFVWPPKSTS